MEVTPAGMVIAVSLLAFWNIPSPMDVSLLPAAKVTVARALAPKNAEFPMEVTPAGMVIAVRLLADPNATFPIDVSLLPDAKVTVVSALALLNA